MEYEQLAAITATTQLLATYTYPKEKRRTLGIYSRRKTDDLPDTEWKVVTHV